MHYISFIPGANWSSFWGSLLNNYIKGVSKRNKIEQSFKKTFIFVCFSQKAIKYCLVHICQLVLQGKYSNCILWICFKFINLLIHESSDPFFSNVCQIINGSCAFIIVRLESISFIRKNEAQHLLYTEFA
jgi:hypothetical protein